MSKSHVNLDNHMTILCYAMYLPQYWRCCSILYVYTLEHIQLPYSIAFLGSFTLLMIFDKIQHNFLNHLTKVLEQNSWHHYELHVFSLFTLVSKISSSKQLILEYPLFTTPQSFKCNQYQILSCTKFV